MPEPRATPDAEPGGRGRWALRGLFALALVLMLREAQVLLAPVVIALVLTFVLTPAVRWQRQHGVPEALGAGLVVVALLGSVVPLAAVLAEPAAQWWQRAPATLEQALKQIDRLRAAIPGLEPPARAAPTAASPAPAPREADPVKERLASEGVALTGLLLGRSAAFAASAAATVILLYFMLASEHWLLGRCVEALPRRRMRALLLGGFRAAQRDIAHYLVAMSLINLGVGITTGLALNAIGLPNPMLWGVATGVVIFVPYIGPLMMVVLLLLAGMLSLGDGPAMLAPAAAFVAIHAVEGNLISPWIIGRRLLLSPLSVFLSVMFWGWVWGVVGALVAVPVLIGVRALVRRHRRLRGLCVYLDGQHRPPPTLHALLEAQRGRWPVRHGRKT